MSGVGPPYTVAVGIPTRNRPEKLERCLECLRRQRSVDFQVIIADSSDRDDAKRICEQFKGQFHSFTYVRHDRSGASAARNVISELCEADLLVYVDDDVYTDQDGIHQLVDYYRKAEGPERFLLGASVKFPHGPSKPGKLSRDGVGFPTIVDSADYLISALIVIPKGIYKTIPWNERLEHGYDDIFYCLKCKKLGMRLEFFDQVLATHDAEYLVRTRQSQISGISSKTYTMLYKHLVYSRSWLGLLILETYGCMRTLMWHLQPYVFNPFLAVRLLAVGIWSWVKGHYWFLDDLKRLLRARSVFRARQNGQQGS